MLLRDFISRYLESGVKSELGSAHLFPKPDGVREGESGARTQGQEGGGSRYGAAYVASHLSADASSAHNSQSKGAEVAYVSQHSLLHQEPGLQECFTVPEYTMGRGRRIRQPQYPNQIRPQRVQSDTLHLIS
jgi:hypothetical protein